MALFALVLVKVTATTTVRPARAAHPSALPACQGSGFRPGLGRAWSRAAPPRLARRVRPGSRPEGRRESSWNRTNNRKDGSDNDDETSNNGNRSKNHSKYSENNIKEERDD